MTTDRFHRLASAAYDDGERCARKGYAAPRGPKGRYNFRGMASLFDRWASRHAYLCEERDELKTYWWDVGFMDALDKALASRNRYDGPTCTSY